MIVKYINSLKDNHNSKKISSWLTIGKLYNVLSIFYSMESGGFIRLMSDGNNGIALFSINQFEVITNKIPSSWVINWSSKGYFELAPEAWTKTGFLERFYDKDPEVMNLVNEEVQKIMKDESWEEGYKQENC